MSGAPIEFQEQRLLVRFPADAWQVLKWDDDPLYGQRIQKLQGTLTKRGVTTTHRTKAVDLVAMHPVLGLHFIELKDFRGYEAENEHRHEHELPLEIGLKVRDTIAGLLGSYRIGNVDGRVAPFTSALVDRRVPLQVIAWIAEDAPGARDRHKRAVRDSARRTALANKLGWLTRRVWVDDPLALAVDLGGVAVAALG